MSKTPHSNHASPEAPLLSGAQMVCQSLSDLGVKHLFGYPGGSVLDIYDALFQHSDEIEHILVRHEQAAVHAADAYARATGQVGVCLVTSGPGATNTLTGIATAYMDSIPLVVLSGNVPTFLIGNDAFHDWLFAPYCETHLLVQNRRGDPDGDCQSVLYRSDRPPRPGGGGLAERYPEPGA